MSKKPNAFVMVEAIKEEVDAACKEKRNPKSLNVIKIFRRLSTARLSSEEVIMLFDIVFKEYMEITGSQVCKIGPDGNN